MVVIISFVPLHVDHGRFLSLPSEYLLFCNLGCEFSIDWFSIGNLKYLGVGGILRTVA